MIRTVRIVFLAGVLGALVWPLAGAGGGEPARPGADERAEADSSADAARGPVERLQAALLESMRRGEELGFDGRADLIREAVERTHSVRALARLVLDEDWDGLTEAQQDRFVESLKSLTIASYAARFRTFDNEAFRIADVRTLRENVAYVRTNLRRTSGELISLDYVLREFDAGWRIVNIVAQGVSEVSVKRAEYGSIMSSRGFDALIEEIDRQARAFGEGE